MSVCYGYGRHSTNKQELTAAAQEKRCVEYWEKHLKDKGVEWGGFHYDKATSARIPFGERQSGRIVLLASKPGDHVVVTKMDRAFRSLRDGITTMDQWSDRGVTFHTMDLQVDTGTPLGRFFRQILLAVAELEREFARERTAEIVAARKKEGKPYSKAIPAGWRVVGIKGSRKWKVDEEERRLIDRMAEMREDGESYERISSWSRRQRELPCKRRFGTKDTARWAISARAAGYPKVCNYKTFNKLVASGDIVLCQT